MIREPIGSGSESVNRIYNMYAETNQQMTYAKQLIKEDRGDEAVAYVKSHPNTLDAIVLTATIGSFSELNKVVDAIRISDTLSAE